MAGKPTANRAGCIAMRTLHTVTAKCRE